jgi:hypothetical protein
MAKHKYGKLIEEELTKRGYYFRKESGQDIAMGASIDDVLNSKPRTNVQGESISWILHNETIHQRLADYGPQTSIIKSRIGNLELTYLLFDDGSEGISIQRGKDNLVNIDLKVPTDMQRWINLLNPENKLYVSGLEYLNKELQKPSITPEEVLNEILDFTENHSYL